MRISLSHCFHFGRDCHSFFYHCRLALVSPSLGIQFQSSEGVVLETRLTRFAVLSLSSSGERNLLTILPSLNSGRRSEVYFVVARVVIPFLRVTMSEKLRMSRNTLFLPERSPLLEIGISLPRPSLISTIFPPKSITGAAERLVPTPKPSPTTPRSDTSFSSRPPDTKIFTFLPPLWESSQRTSSTIFFRSPLRLEGVSSLTPYKSRPRASIALMAANFSSLKVSIRAILGTFRGRASLKSFHAFTSSPTQRMKAWGMVPLGSIPRSFAPRTFDTLFIPPMKELLSIIGARAGWTRLVPKLITVFPRSASERRAAFVQTPLA